MPNWHFKRKQIKNENRGYAQPLPVDNLRIRRENTRTLNAYTRLKRPKSLSQQRKVELPSQILNDRTPHRSRPLIP